ncbi:MAG TPA: hypothetical protein VLC12_07830, partial [Terriglobales bacterium]|nr:hypothetical protein [Terriglobales bacterium]
MGEPHLQTADGMHFDFQAVGEFQVASSPDKKYVIQARQEAWGDVVTINTAVAANVNGDRVGVYAKEPSFLTVNGKPVEGVEWEQHLPHDGFVQRHAGLVVIRWPDGGRLTVRRIVNSLNYGFEPNPASGLKMGGLLGMAGGSDRIASRDGGTVLSSDPEFRSKLYQRVGNSWRIKQSESLFHYWPGESTGRFTDLGFPHKLVSAASLESKVRAQAEATCRAVGVQRQPALDDCILDVGITGMPAFAAAMAGMNAGATSAPTAAVAGNGGSAAAAASRVENFAIRIGDSIAPDHPLKGAGMLTQAGERQIYSFSASRPTNIYVSVSPCQGVMPSFELRASDDAILGGRIGCGDFGPVRLPQPGTYRMVASANGDSARYSFTLREAASDEFAIKIGDTVSPDHPRAGAGSITQAGQRQSYSFPARQGDIVYLGIGPCQGAVPSFNLRKPDDSLLDMQIGCHDLGREVLPTTGTYEVVASTDRPAGQYSFSLSAVPPDQHFAARLPLTVAPDSPGRGAGRITARGAQQFYDFTSRAGMTVHIEGKCATPCPNLVIRATSVGDNSRFSYFEVNRL